MTISTLCKLSWDTSHKQGVVTPTLCVLLTAVTGVTICDSLKLAWPHWKTTVTLWIFHCDFVTFLQYTEQHGGLYLFPQYTGSASPVAAVSIAHIRETTTCTNNYTSPLWSRQAFRPSNTDWEAKFIWSIRQLYIKFSWNGDLINYNFSGVLPYQYMNPSLLANQVSP